MKKKLMSILTSVAILISIGNVAPKANIVSQINVNAATANQLNISNEGKEFIISMEGFSSSCFWDYAQWTIGYGTKCTHTSHPSNPSVGQKGGHTISRDEAKDRFYYVLDTVYEPGVERRTSGLNLTQNQFDALVSLCYNAGEGRVFDAPLTKYLRGEMSKDAAYSSYCNYCVTAGGSVLDGLRKRRKAEADLFFSDSPDIKLLAPVPHTASKSYVPGSTVTVEWDSVSGATGYWIDVWKNQEHILTENLGNVNKYTISKIDGGEYDVFLAAYSSKNGSWNSITSDMYSFSVKDIGATTVRTNHKYYAPNADIDIMWDSVENATGYWIDIWKNQDGYISQHMNNSTAFTYNFGVGRYDVFVHSFNEANDGWSKATSEMYTFYVLDTTPTTVSTSKEYYPKGEAAEIYWNDVTGATGYWIDLWKDGEHIFTQNLGNKLSYSDTLDVGAYDVFVHAYNDIGGYTSATSDVYRFYVKDTPSTPKLQITSEKNLVNIKWNECTDTDYYAIHILKYPHNTPPTSQNGKNMIE